MTENQQKQHQRSPARITAEHICLTALLIITIVLILLARSHLKTATANFEPDLYYPLLSTNQLAALNPPAKDQFRENGRYLYTTACAPCHQPDGNGAAGQYPPLANSEWVLASGPGRLIRIMLHGIQGEIEVCGVKYNNTMVPWKDLLNDSQIAAILTFIRTELGNKASAVSPDHVKAIREKTLDRSEQWTAEELLQIQEFE
ncbi:MAG: c-type cytochrome [Verrucomicrobiia bacterium]